MQGLPEPISYVKNIYVSGIKGTIEKLGTIEGNQKTEFGRIILEDVNVKAQTDKFDVSDQIKELTLQNVTVNGAAVQH